MKPVPDYFEPITAYRAFDVYPNGLLVGQAHAEPWPPYAPFVARCGFVHPDGFAQHLDEAGAFLEAPVFKCDCGIHALKSHEALIDRRDKDWAAHQNRFSFSFGGMFEHYRPNDRAWGTVKLWGRIIEHQEGYRAQFAYPASLECDDEAIAVRIATLYGVPCGYVAKPKPEKAFDWYAGVQWPPFTAPVAPAIIQPAYVPPPSRTIPAPAVVGASRWEIKHYGQLKDGPKVDVPEDWRAILAKMVYLNPKKVVTDLKAGVSINFVSGYLTNPQPSAASQGVKRP